MEVLALIIAAVSLILVIWLIFKCSKLQQQVNQLTGKQDRKKAQHDPLPPPMPPPRIG